MLKFIAYCLFTILSHNISGYQAQDCSNIQAPKATLTTEQAWIDDAVEQHNKYRRKHSAVDLKLNAELAKVSQNWANHLASTNGFDHSHYDGLGENLYMSGSTVKTFKVKPGAAEDDWYSEIKYYNFETGESTDPKEAVGHFTQLVWKGSHEIGIAYKCYEDGPFTKCVVVANYCPPGNFMSEYQSNVERAGSGNEVVPNNEVDSPREDVKQPPTDLGRNSDVANINDNSKSHNKNADIESTSATSSNSTASPSVLQPITGRYHGLILILWLGRILSFIMISY